MSKKPGTAAVPKPATEKPKRKSPVLLSQEEKRAIAAKICDDYQSGEFTLESCCHKHGISARTIWDWCDRDPETAATFKKAKQLAGTRGRDDLKEKALTSLQKMILGFYVEEPETETTTIKNAKGVITQTITRTKTKKKYIAPVPAAVIFTLKNVDPENWNRSEPTGPVDDTRQVWKIGDQVIEF